MHIKFNKIKNDIILNTHRALVMLITPCILNSNSHKIFIRDSLIFNENNFNEYKYNTVLATNKKKK